MKLEDLQSQIECDRFSLAKWSPMATKMTMQVTMQVAMQVLNKAYKP